MTGLGDCLVAPPGWAAAGTGLLGAEMDEVLASWRDRPAVKTTVAGAAEHSPYLRGLMRAAPGRLAAILAAEPDAFMGEVVARIAAGRTVWTPAQAAAALRAARGEVALAAALADIGGAWRLEQVTGALTRFADAAVDAALCALLRDAHGRGQLVLPEPDRPERGCGLVVLALGKLGGGELNYSSDIDVVAYFDPGAGAVPAERASQVYVRLVQALARLLGDRTADGFVERVDLRLRPDPGSTAVAMSVASALRYYEARGQNWERAALIKARPVAGDAALGDGLLAELGPFVWRRYFDYAALADIHAMKRQIHVAKGHASLAVAGHDVKLGRGGIREIEFFVQTQQLIFGGRRPHLRGRRTLEVLAAFGRDGWIEPAAVTALTEAYRFLRGVEHRLQMVDDQQTHRLPSEPEALARFARFAGYPDTAAFSHAFLTHAAAVERHYARLFEKAPTLTDGAGSLVFTGVEDDPATLETLGRLGFARPAAVSETVRGWHFGRRPAIRTPRAREVLTELTPALLAELGRASDPDAALAAVDGMFGRMPAAVELLSLLRSTPALLDLFGDIVGVAPALAATVASRPHVLDAVIGPAGAAVDGADALAARVSEALPVSLQDEDFLDRARDVAAEERFAIGVRLLSGALGGAEAGRRYAELAEAVVAATFAHVRASFATVHGDLPPGAGCAVVALGRLGSRDMTATSDLDLMLVYEAGDGGDSAGPRPLDPARYFARLTQRLIAALTVATRRGGLYAVDLRLRPSGRQGPLATSLASFRHYHAADAATWEHMALTRARVVAGDAEVAAAVTDAVGAVLRQRRDPTVVRADAAAMRALLAREKPPRGPWDLKRVPGGLTDIEFMAQALTLAHSAADLALPDTAIPVVLHRLGEGGWLPAAEADALLAAYGLLTDLHHLIRLACAEAFDPATAGTGLRERLAAAVDVPDFGGAEAALTEATARAAAIVAEHLPA